LQAVVVDDLGVVDHESRTVVAREPELVVPGGRHRQVGERVRDEALAQAEVGLCRVVDGRLQLVDVRRLAGAERAQLAQVARHVIGPQRDAGFLRRQVVCRRSGGDGPCQHHCCQRDGGRACGSLSRADTGSTLCHEISSVGIDLAARTYEVLLSAVKQKL
jgi:hypothetical protein